jgi:hypothetical protein
MQMLDPRREFGKNPSRSKVEQIVNQQDQVRGLLRCHFRPGYTSGFC